jgi:pimeloyl-ACP methyl ester carboxylesterase
MPFQTGHRILIQNTRSLSYTIYGDPTGTPLFYFHGLPSSSFELNIPECIQIAERLHARIIVIDRPGIGHSDFWPYTIAGFPDMVTEVADSLRIDRFAVMGTSSGGKYVAACAWKIPERLLSATIISGTAPFDLPGVRQSLSVPFRLIYATAEAVPRIFQPILRMFAQIVSLDPLKVLALAGMLSPSDRRVLSRSAVNTLFRQMIKHSVLRGARGGAHDWYIESLPWGFALQEIRIPVAIHHGDDDWLLSGTHARILASHIPGTKLTMHQGEGHTLFINRFEELVRAAII